MGTIAEGFFHSLMVEVAHGEPLAMHEALRIAVFEYIETDYNTTSHHSTLGIQTPAAVELTYAT